MDMQARSESSTDSRAYRLWKATSQVINLGWLLVLFGAAFAILALLRFDLPLADLQIVFFPIVLLAFWRLPRIPGRRIPVGWIVAALLFWVGGVIYVRAYFPTSLLKPVVYLSRLNNDPDGQYAKDLYRRYNEIARAYELPPMEIVLRRLRGNGEGRAWLARRSNALSLVGGNPEWLRVLIPDGAVPTSYRAAKTPTFLSDEAEKFQLDLLREAWIVRRDGFEFPFLLSKSSDLLFLPGRSPELGRHFLAWFIAGIKEQRESARKFETIAAEAEEEDEGLRGKTLVREGNDLSRAAFYLAAEIRGPWATHAPRAEALFQVAMTYIFERLEDSEWGRRRTNCAERTYRKALASVDVHFHPELYSSLFNNAAVARILGSYYRRDFRRAERWLRRAARVTDRNGVPTRGAKVAMLNLMVLRRSGFL